MNKYEKMTDRVNLEAMNRTILFPESFFLTIIIGSFIQQISSSFNPQHENTHISLTVQPRLVMNEKESSFNYNFVRTLSIDELNMRQGSGKSATKDHGLISFNTLHSQERLEAKSSCVGKFMSNNRQKGFLT